MRRRRGVLAGLAACKAVDEDQAGPDARLSPPSAATEKWREVRTSLWPDTVVVR